MGKVKEETKVACQTAVKKYKKYTSGIIECKSNGCYCLKVKSGVERRIAAPFAGEKRRVWW